MRQAGPGKPVPPMCLPSCGRAPATLQAGQTTAAPGEPAGVTQKRPWLLLAREAATGTRGRLFHDRSSPGLHA